VLHSFGSAGSDGLFPTSRLAIGSGGVLYGTTISGGTDNVGTIFSLTHSFHLDGRADAPAGVVVSSEGILYRTAGGGEYPEEGTV